MTTRTTGYMALSARFVVAVMSGDCTCRQCPHAHCGCSDERDNDPSTKLSRGFIVVLVVLATAAVVGLRARRDRNGEGEQWQQTGQGADAEAPHRDGNDFSPGGSNRQTLTGPHGVPDQTVAGIASNGSVSGFIEELCIEQPKKERLWYLDYARIICVACVVTEHSGGSMYSERNIAWVQQWVLPYLYAVSGYSYMFSSGSILAYLRKLAAVFLIGVSANWFADAINGRDWKNDFSMTCFQMMYVAVIGVTSFVLTPLRQALRWRHQNQAEPAPLCMLAWTGVVGALTFILLIVGIVRGFSANISESYNGAKAFFTFGPYVFATFSASCFLCMLICAMGCDGRAGWVLMAFMYIHRMVIAYSRGGHPVNVDIFMLGMLVQKVPLYGAATLAQTAREYWPIVFVLLLLLSTPGVTGRCDLHPHYHGWERVRFYSIEWILMLLLISGAYNTSDSRQITPWLNKWALYAFCFHAAWARIWWEPMYGAVFTYLAIPVFYALERYLVKCTTCRQEATV